MNNDAPRLKREELRRLINEGIWDSLKHMASKWGSMEKGGKLTGKDEYVEKARQQFSTTLDKVSNAAVKKLVDEIQGEFKDFPNEKDKWAFLNGVSAIAVFYDSLAAAVEKYKEGGPKAEGAMAPEVANGMVEALREYVRTLLDVELADVYKHFNEEEEHHGEELLDEVDWAKKERELAAEEEAEARTGKGKKQGPEDVLKTKEKSGTWKGLESNALPMALGLAGAGFGAAHMALAKMFLGPNGGEIAEDVYKMVQEKAPDEEYINYVEGKLGEDASLKGGNFLSMAAPPGGDTANFADNIDYYAEKTGRDPEDIVSMLAAQNPKSDFGPELSNEASQLLYKFNKGGAEGNAFWAAIGNSDRAPSRAFQQFAAENGASEKLLGILKQPGSMSGSPKAAGTLIGVASGNYSLDIPGVTKMVAQILKRQGEVHARRMLVKTGAGGMAAAAGGTKLGAIVAGSGILSTLGIGLGAAAGAVKLLRLKGRKSSRAQVLNDLEGTLKDFQGEGPLGDQPEEPAGEVPPEERPGDDAPPEVLTPPAKDPEAEDEEKGEEEKRLLGLIRMDDDGLKFYRGRRKNPEKRDAERDKMKQAQDNAITGRNTDPSSEDLRNFFGKMFAKDKDVEGMTLDQIAKLVRGKSQRELEPYVTIDASVYGDMARALKQVGFIKTARLTNKLKGAVKDALETLLRQVVSKSPIKKLTYKQAQPTLIRAFKGMGIKLDKDSNAMFALLRIIKDYGLIRGDVPQDTEETPASDAPSGDKPSTKKTKKTPPKATVKGGPDAPLQEGIRRQIKRWRLLAGINK